MATSSVPTLNMNSGWEDPQKSSQSEGGHNNSLELGMSGMHLFSSVGNDSVDFSGSPDAPSELTEDIMNSHMEQRKHIIDSSDSVHSQRSNTSTASSLPAIVMNRSHGVPSPIGRPGHSKSSSISTAQSFTLTPTSSLDGGSDLHDYSRRGREEHDLPSRITTTMGDGFDGIHGNRDRANTAPGPLTYPTSDGVMHSSHRPRSVSRDGGNGHSSSSRPPLAGTSYIQESSDLRAPGIISRPGYGQPMSDHTLQRPTSTDTGRETLLSSSYPGQHAADHQHLSHKFGSLPTLSSHLTEQRGLNPNQPSFQPLSRHQRSLSTPGPDYGHHHQEDLSYRQGGDFGSSMPRHNDYGMASQDSRYGNFSMGASDGISRTDLHRSSLQTLPSSGGPGFYGQNHSNNPHRMESLDFVPGHTRYPDSAPVIASDDEMRTFMNSDYERVGPNSFPRHERMVSPGPSPLHQHYGGHSRHHNDSLPSSPMSLGGGNGVRPMPGQSRNAYGANTQGIQNHRVPSVDEEFAHPLAGENIEVPADDHGYMHEGASFRSGRAGSADVIPLYYGGAESAHHLPTAGAALPMQKAVYSVKFKRTQRSFAIGPRLNRDLKIGTYVKVEADRGEDLGIVVGRISSEKRSNYRGEMGIMPPQNGTGGSGTADLKRITRLATHDEVSLLVMKRDEEDELLKICRGKARQRGLRMNVVDAEYQFDRHKLTFFFEAEGRVDFRELVRDLFSIYKTRIWMQQLDKNTASTCQAAMNPSVQVAMDYGTPIIAPVSEFREFVTGDEIEAG